LAPETRAPTSTYVDVKTQKTFRGETALVTGYVQAFGVTAEDLHVDIYFEGPGGSTFVGSATTAADGRFEVTVDVPLSLKLGPHYVHAKTRGDDRRQPSRSP
jgi:hypothetical protein